jgi:predicted DNA-binding protein YlxM (UPF0122 family)
MQWIDGRVPLKEKLLKDPAIRDKIPIQDYNNVISNLITKKNKNHIDEIRNIHDLTVRAISCMLWADISIKQIAPILKMSRQSVYKKMKHFINDNSKL